MSIEAVLFLSMVVGALAVFAAALAYGDRVAGGPPSENSNTLQSTDRTKNVTATPVYKKAA